MNRKILIAIYRLLIFYKDILVDKRMLGYSDPVYNAIDTELKVIHQYIENTSLVDTSPNWVDEIVRKFKSRVSIAEIDDVRPVSYEMFQKDRGEGLTIWLKNGDMLVYYPKGETE